MKTGIKVGDIMTRRLIVVSPETKVRDCVKSMFKGKTGSLLVMNSKWLLGVVTKRDILRGLLRKDISRLSAADVMTRRVKTISPNIDLYDALLRMKKTKIKKLPVMENGNVIGMLTIGDILRLQPHLFDYVAEAVYIKEESAKLRKRGKLISQKKMVGFEDSISGPCEKCGNY
ncbi:MAG: CBS domain-containing protein, partial [Nanoarchaeota archaeon]